MYSAVIDRSRHAGSFSADSFPARSTPDTLATPSVGACGAEIVAGDALALTRSGIELFAWLNPDSLLETSLEAAKRRPAPDEEEDDDDLDDDDDDQDDDDLDDDDDDEDEDEEDDAPDFGEESLNDDFDDDDIDEDDLYYDDDEVE